MQPAWFLAGQVLKTELPFLDETPILTCVRSLVRLFQIVTGLQARKDLKHGSGEIIRK